MSTNQYFLVNKIDNQNYFIIQGPMQLPDNFGPTSGFNVLEESSPELLSDLCNVTYTIKTLTAQELSERVEVLRSQIRMIRDRYLSLTDFTQLSDVPFSTQAKSEFATFRQQLRDLPNTSDPTTIIWPSIPTLVNINLPPFPPVPTYRSS